MSAQSVLKAIDPEKYDITEIGITHEGEWLVGENVLEAMLTNHTENLMAVTLLPDTTRRGLFRIRETGHGDTLENLIPLDVVFPVLHGTFGEDGTIQGLLELDGVAYVGAGVAGSAVGMDKGIFNDVMIAQHIPVVETAVVMRSEIDKDVRRVMERIEQDAQFKVYPLFVKPANLGSSVGITKVHNHSDLLEALLEAARFDRRVLVQRGVNAREIEVSVLGNDDPQASMPGEIIPSREFYSYEAKYLDGTSELLIPAPIPAELVEKARERSVRAFKAIDCCGMARVDFLLDKDNGELYLNEINTIPGFTQISMYPKLWEASGVSYPALIDRLIDLAIERKSDRDRTERRYKVD